MNLGAKIRAEREARDWRIEDLASASKCSFRTIYRIEKGEPVRLDTVAKIARALGVTLSELLEGVEFD